MPPRDDENVPLPDIPDFEDAGDVALPPIPDMDGMDDAELPPIPALPQVQPIAVDMSPPQDGEIRSVDVPLPPEAASAFESMGFQRTEQAQPQQADMGALVDKLSKLADVIGSKMGDTPQSQQANVPDAAKVDDTQQGQFREFIDALRTLVDRIAPSRESLPEIPGFGDTQTATGEVPDPVEADELPAIPTDAGDAGLDGGRMDQVVALLEKQNDLLTDFRQDFISIMSELLG